MICRKMSHDETIYADPMIFNPDRFLGPNPEPDPMDIVFGFGRYVVSSVPPTAVVTKRLTTGAAVPGYTLRTQRYTLVVPCP
jgi:cytochrome P450